MSDVAFSENWEIKYKIGDCKLMPHDGRWKQVISIDEETGNRGWSHISIVDVPVRCLIYEWEKLVVELSDKEFDLAGKKEQYAKEEFEIVYQSDINFNELYGSTSEKVRKQHAKDVLSDLSDEIQSLELSINWIRGYIPLLKEVVRTKQC